jgi:hypothetical protein
VTPRLIDRFPIRGRDWILFLTSLFLASVVWLVSNLSRSYSGIVSIPVVAECRIDGHSDVSANVVTVAARCHTTGFRLISNRYSKDRKPVRIKVDRQDLHLSGKEEFYLTGPVMNNYTGEIFGDETQVDAFISDTLWFRFPAQNHKRVPVELVQDITYRPQYMSSAALKIEPDSVTIYGEAARIDNVDRIFTSSLNLYDVHENRHGTLRLGKIKGVRLSEEEVHYTMTVSRYVEISVNLPVEVWNAPAGRRLQVYPSSADVVFRCVFPVSKDPTESVRLYIDYEDFLSSLNGRCIPKALSLPPGVIDYYVFPEVFDCILTE